MNGFFKLKNNDWLMKQRIAGKCVATCLNFLQKSVKDGTTLTALELSKATESIISDFNCTATFKGYKGFPEAVCISVNKELVHGIPKNITFKSGDVISFDLGATYQGAIADAAVTCIYGDPISIEHIKLIDATEEALMKGIAAISVGKQLGVIGNAIHKSAKNNGFSGLINHYGGHGLSWDTPHDLPFVANKSRSDEGIRIQEGLSIAIEPMLVLGDTNTYIDKDGWTVWGMGISAHFEHTIFIHKDYVEIITDRSIK